MANILIVDDDVELSTMVEFALSDAGYTVTLVHRGMEGWKQIRTNQHDLVVLDWDMPDLNGIDLLKKIRDEGITTPVIMLTGHAAVKDKVDGLTSGANDYLVKPFHVDELLARIMVTLKSQKAVPKPLGQYNEEVLEKGNLKGTTLASRYDFQEIWGEGGAAIVFKARHPTLDKLMAVKMLKSSELNEEMIARFELEAKAISKLEHKNIIGVYDYGVTEHNNPYMVMEFINGDDLKRILQRRDFLPLEEGLDLLLQVCDGLAHAHEAGILHRDFKPSNIMLKEVANGPPVPKLLDFGMAKVKEADPQRTIQLTQARQVFGSPPYMSPEQIRGHELDERSDIYSLGCTVLEVLSGFPPHLGKTSFEIMDKRLEEPPLTFAEVRPDMVFPPGLQEIVSKALQLKPEDRYQSVRELAADLRKIKESVAAGAGGS